MTNEERDIQRKLKVLQHAEKIGNARNGAVKLMRTRIRLMAQHKSMHSIIDATRREQRHGSA